MALLSALYHEGQAKDKAGAELRAAKYGGEQETDKMVDLSEPSIPGVLTKKIVRAGNGQLAPVGRNVSWMLDAVPIKSSDGQYIRFITSTTVQ